MEIPRCFKGGRKYPVLYLANQKAWITFDLFYKWPTDVDYNMNKMGKKLFCLPTITPRIELERNLNP